MDEYKPLYDRAGATRWYQRGHSGYFLKDMIDADSRVPIIKTWLTANVASGGKVADIGCGDMSFANLLPQFNWSGFDLDDKKDNRIIKQDISTVPYACKDGTYDAVLCSEVLEHVFEPHVVISEFNRILKLNGKLVVTVPNFDSFEFYLYDHRQLLFNTNEFWTLEHIRWYNLNNMAELLNGRGFKILETMGSAHCFSGIMQYAAQATIDYFKKEFSKTLTVAEAGYLLGKQFPCYSPGISFLAEKVM